MAAAYAAEAFGTCSRLHTRSEAIKSRLLPAKCSTDLACHGRRYDPGMPDPDWFKPDPPVAIRRQRQPGEEVWRLRSPDGTRVQTCELRDDSKAGAGWDVMLLLDGEPVISRRCADERGARYVAQSFKQDTVRAGWVE